MHVTFYINKRMQLTPSPLGLTDLCLNSKYNTCSRPFFTAALLCTWLFAFSYMHSICILLCVYIYVVLSFETLPFCAAELGRRSLDRPSSVCLKDANETTKQNIAPCAASLENNNGADNFTH